MELNNLHLHPKQYFKLKEPLKLFINANITREDFKTLCKSLARRKTPLIISGKYIRKKNGNFWSYYLQMPSFSLQISETDSQRRNLGCNKFLAGENGRNKQYNNRSLPMFLLEASMGTYLVYKNQLFYVSTEGTCTEVSQEEHVDWGMDIDAYDELLERMHSYFNGEDEYVRSQRVSDNMRFNVMTPFEQYTEKEHEFETRKVDFTQGVLYTEREAGAISNGKKSSFVFTSTDASADPETCILAAGQQVTVYSYDQSPTGLVGLLTEIDSDSTDGVRFTLEFYQQFNLDQLPGTGYLFVHQNDTQRKIRKAVARSIHTGKTPAKYMYKTFHDYSVRGYEDLELHPHLTEFLHKRMGQQFPPNQMQLEAIVKGILTDDLLLVLGPPGTGKTTVILSWVEYYLSQGKRVLISSQNNSAVDNVLERLGEDKNREIVRLGRDEKVQENCKQFIPYRRIETMRSSCSSNGQRVEAQIVRECRQIDAYLDALRQLESLVMQTWILDEKQTSLQKKITPLISTITSRHKRIEEIRSNASHYTVQIARHEIFLEESLKKPFLIRLLQTTMRYRAKKKISTWKTSLAGYSKRLLTAKQEYVQAVGQLKQLLDDFRSSGYLHQYQQTHNAIQQLQQRILYGTDDTPALIPTFESELRYLDQVKTAGLSFYNISSLHCISHEIETMQSIRDSADKILAASRHWVHTALKDDRNDIFEEILLDACQVVGATCIGINSNKLFADVNFDVTVIDESGQIQLHNALVPMSRSPKTLMLGDYKQIPPIVNEEIASSCENEGIPTHLFRQSFFEFLFEQMRKREIKRLMDNPKTWLGGADGDLSDAQKEILAREHLLKPIAQNYVGTPAEKKQVDAQGKSYTSYHSRYSPEDVESFIQQIISDGKKIVNLNSQFRMPGHISDVISEWFYESNYFSSYNMSRFQPVVPHTGLPMVIISTSGMAGRFESQPESKMGYQNLSEAELVADILEAVLAEKSEKEQLEYRQSLDKRLGVISAYGAQVRYIRQQLKSRLGFSDSEASTAVASLDSFQGQERDLIIYSLTRSAKKSPEAARVGFLKELRRLNVAFTRCKKQLVIIGDFDYLQSCLYIDKEDPARESRPCTDTADDIIGKLQIDQCAECTLDCERRFSRFFRLLMQHVQADSPAGDLFSAAQFKKMLKGDDGHASKN